MPCRDETHEHNWPREGTLEISKCEIFCGYCTGDDAKVVHPRHWDLRAHIRDVHARGQGLAIIVSPRPPKPHVSTTPAKRKHAEVEESDSEEAEDSDENEKEDPEDEDYEDGSSKKKKGKAKAKTGSNTKAPADPFAGNDNENATSSQPPLRLGAKPAAKGKKDSNIKSHAASFNPVGPKPGPPSPKRIRQVTAMGPPASNPVNNSSGPPHQMPTMAQQQYQQQYLNQMQGLGRAASVPMNNHGQRFAGHPQQNFNNAQRPAGNMGPPSGRMAPPVGDMGSRPGNMGSRPGNMGPPPAGNMPTQNYGRVNPPTGQPMPQGLSAGQNMPRQTTSGAFYNSNPGFITPAYGSLNQQHLRDVTHHMLVNNQLPELGVIIHYQQEIEYIRHLHVDRLIMAHRDQMSAHLAHLVQEQVALSRVGVSVEAIELVLMNHRLIAPRGFSGEQGGGGQRPAFQQAGPQHGPSQQGGPQQGGVQQPAALPAPEESTTEEPAP